MMKNFINKLCLLLAFLTVTTIEVFAQPVAVPTVVRGNGSGDDIIHKIDDCSEGVTFDVYVANLDLLSTVGVGNNYPLPTNAPDMYLHIKILSPGGSNTITPLTFFTYSHNVNGINLYKTSVTVSLPSQSEVGFIAAILKDYETGDIITTDPAIVGDYGIPSGYAFYPIMDYRASGDLFSCTVPEMWTDCECDNTSFGSACNPLPYYPAVIECLNFPEDDGDGNGFGTGGGQSADSGATELENNATASFIQQPIISPNPFSTNLNINYTAQEDDVLNIRIFDINGKEISSFERYVTQGGNEVRLNVPEIPSGIYFIKLSDRYNQYTEKLFKL